MPFVGDDMGHGDYSSGDPYTGMTSLYVDDPQFPRFHFFSIFHGYENGGYPFSIMFIFDICPCSSTAATLVKYENNS